MLYGVRIEDSLFAMMEQNFITDLKTAVCVTHSFVTIPRQMLKPEVNQFFYHKNPHVSSCIKAKDLLKCGTCSL